LIYIIFTRHYRAEMLLNFVLNINQLINQYIDQSTFSYLKEHNSCVF